MWCVFLFIIISFARLSLHVVCLRLRATGAAPRQKVAGGLRGRTVRHWLDGSSAAMLWLLCFSSSRSTGAAGGGDSEESKTFQHLTVSWDLYMHRHGLAAASREVSCLRVPDSPSFKGALIVVVVGTMVGVVGMMNLVPTEPWSSRWSDLWLRVCVHHGLQGETVRGVDALLLQGEWCSRKHTSIGTHVNQYGVTRVSSGEVMGSVMPFPSQPCCFVIVAC